MSWPRGSGVHPVLPGQLSSAPGDYLHILYLDYHSYIYTFIFIHLHIYIYLCTRDTRRVTACAGRGSPGPAVTSALWDSGEWCMSTFYDVTKSLTPAPGTTRTASRAPARWRVRWAASAAGTAGASATSPATSATAASRASSRSSTPTPRGAQSASATASR